MRKTIAKNTVMRRINSFDQVITVGPEKVEGFKLYSVGNLV